MKIEDVDGPFWEAMMEYIGGQSRTLVGSTYIMGEGNDIDMLILVDDLSTAAAWFCRKGWHNETLPEEYEDAEFISFRAGDNNALLTADRTFFCDFARAAEVCKYLRVADRPTRCAIHRIVRDGADWDAV